MAPPKKTTIYDVARHAKVAISTVSRVLNNSSEVSAATRKRIQAAIEELQFRPDRTAKMLAHKDEYVLSVAVPSFTSTFYNELLKGVKDAVQDREMDLMLCNLGSASPKQALLKFLKRGAVDALIVASIPVDRVLHHELKMLNAPVVVIGDEVEEFDCFFWDDEAGSRKAVQHLIENGHRRIGMLTPRTSNLNTEARVVGYRAALEAAAIPFDENLLASGETSKHSGYSEEAGFEGMQKLLRLAEPVTAVFATSDVQAIGAWAAIREAGLAVPDDINLVGYDDVKVSSYLGLSSVDQHMYKVGQKATEVVLSRIGDRTSPRHKHPVESDLKIRFSSDKNTQSPT